jgi:hypothetical protein
MTGWHGTGNKATVTVLGIYGSCRIRNYDPVALTQSSLADQRPVYNSPNNSDKIKLKQKQCCQLGGLKYIYSEILNSLCEKQTGLIKFNYLFKSDKILAADY